MNSAVLTDNPLVPSHACTHF